MNSFLLKTAAPSFLGPPSRPRRPPPNISFCPSNNKLFMKPKTEAISLKTFAGPSENVESDAWLFEAGRPEAVLTSHQTLVMTLRCEHNFEVMKAFSPEMEEPKDIGDEPGLLARIHECYSPKPLARDDDLLWKALIAGYRQAMEVAPEDAFYKKEQLLPFCVAYTNYQAVKKPPMMKEELFFVLTLEELRDAVGAERLKLASVAGKWFQAVGAERFKLASVAGKAAKWILHWFN